MKKMMTMFALILTMVFSLQAENIIPVRTDVTGFATWTDVDIAGTTYLQLLKATASVTTPAMDFSTYTGEALNFKARTYGGTNATENTITISISENNGTDWVELGTRLPLTNSLVAMTSFDLSSYNAAQTKIKFTVAGTSNSIGIGIDDITISGSPVVSTPTITLNTNTLSFPKTKINEFSVEKTFIVSGSLLTDPVVLTTPAGFQTSTTSGSGYGTSDITLTPTAGTLAATTIYVRFAPTVEQTYTGDIACASTGATTKNVALSGIGADFLSFTDFEGGTLGDWTAFSVASDKNWGVALVGANSTVKSAEMNGYLQDVASNDWLVSPALTWAALTKHNLDFYSSRKYGSNNDELTLKYSTDYSGSGDPSSATWTTLNFEKPATAGDTWFSSGNIDLSAITTFPVYIAFHYQASANPARWRVDEITIKSNSTSVPVAPNAIAATSITATDFTANWEASSGALKYYLDVATDDAFTSILSSYNNLNVADVTTYDVTGLAANTPYYYRVRAYNDGGSSANSNTVAVPMVGNYSAATSGDLANLLADLNGNGVSGSVTIDLAAGATFTGPFTIDPIPGNSATNRLIIKSEDPLNPATFVGASGKADEGPLTLTGTNFVTIQDLNYTNNSAVAGTYVIQFANGAQNKTIQNCTITAGSNTLDTYGILLGNDCSNNTITGNTILKAGTGIYANSVGAASSNLQITNNNIGSTTPALSVGAIGVNLVNCDGALVSQNTIHNIALSSEPIGVNVGTDVVNSAISRNNINNIYGQISGALALDGSRGIKVVTGNTASNITVDNNMITAIAGNVKTAFGIYADGATGGVNMYYNSINLTGDIAKADFMGVSSQAAAIGINDQVTAALDIRNNILMNSMTNSLDVYAKSFAIASRSNLQPTTIDYNNYFVSGAHGVLASFNSIDQTSMGALQTSYGQNLNSKHADVVFVDPPDATGVLRYQRIPANIHLFNTGTVDALTVTDFYGDPRKTMEASDIGAYEMPAPSAIVENIPLTTSLSQNYPNPFNPETTINFGLAKDMTINLTVYNVNGQVVKSLVNNNMKAGYHKVSFNATGLNSGVYIYKLTTPETSYTKKMIMVK